MADLTRIKKIKCTENHEHEIDAIAWDGYETSDLATIDGRDLLEGGDITTIQEIPYDGLVYCRDNSLLIPGKQYRIINYKTVISASNALMSTNNQFDIIVTADSENTLSEKARACVHMVSKEDGFPDPYFANSDLNAWQIWYCLDNDSNRFEWANEEFGRGVIYRMIDEWGNDCPYDFKSIMFSRDVYINGAGVYHSNSALGFKYTSKYCYTFSRVAPYGDGEWEIYDASLNNYHGEEGLVDFGVYNNIIKPYISHDEDWDNIIPQQFLNDIVFFNGGDAYVNDSSQAIKCYNNTFGANCYNNTFGDNCYDNTFGAKCYNNTFNNYCDSNTFGDYCYSNYFGMDCKKNTFGIKCAQNTFRSSCGGNTFGSNCEGNILHGNNVVNTFGNTCYGNILGESSSYNIFGNLCSNNIFYNRCSKNILLNSCVDNDFSSDCVGNSLGSECTAITLFSGCKDNSFGNACRYINLGERCIGNSFGNNCYDNNFQISSDYEQPLNRCCYNHFDDGCSLIRIVCNKQDNSDYLKNININRGVCGTSRVAREIIFIHNINSENEINVYNDKGHIYVDYGDINVTYEQLKTLVANKQLTPGRDYRIIDYVTTTSQEDTKSAGHQFDIIVTALDESTLSEEAKAIQHDGDEYFVNSNLSAWKIWYSLDNDTSRFAWAGNSRVDKTYTKLEYTNECEYAFNIPYQMDDEVGKNQFDKWVVVKGKMINDTEDLGTYDQAKLNEVFSHWDYMENADGDFILTVYTRLIDGVYQSGNYQDNGLSGEYYQYDGVTTIDGIDYDLWKKSDIINGEYSHVYLLTERIVTTKAENPYFYAHSETVELEPKGIIYRMIDEFNNDCPYDFKNIMFTRMLKTPHLLTKEESEANSYSDCYTFTWIDSNNILRDASLKGFEGNGSAINGEIVGNVYSNIIKSYNVNTYDGGGVIVTQTLNNIVFLSSARYDSVYYGCYNNIFANGCCNNSFNNECYNNTFGNRCYNNFFGNNCYNNTFGNSCTDNTFGNNCYNNIFGNNCYNNTFGNSCTDNTFSSDCHTNTFINLCQNNTFGFDCLRNTFGSGCLRNTFGNSCTDNTFGSGCYNNTFGFDCYNNTFGSRCYTNTFGSGCNTNILGDDCNLNTFDNLCQNNTFGIECTFNTFGNKCSDNIFDDICYNNTFGIECTLNTFGSVCYDNTFGNNCYINTFGSNCYTNTFGSGCNTNILGDDCNLNTFGKHGYNNTFGNSCTDNTFGDYCIENTILYNCYCNSFGNACHDNTLNIGNHHNTFGSNCYTNTFGDSCYYNDCRSYFNNNTFGISCYYNSFGVYCRNITFGASCYANTLGNNCNYIKFGSNCYHNTFGNTCSYTYFGAYAQNNNIGNSCYYIIFGTSTTSLLSYYRNIIVDSYNRYIKLQCTSTTSSTKYYQNVRICLGVNNTSSYKTIADANVGQAYETRVTSTNSITKEI